MVVIQRRVLLILATMIFAFALGWFSCSTFENTITGLTTGAVAEKPSENKGTVAVMPNEQKPSIEFIEIRVPDCNLCIDFETLKKQLKDMNIALKEKTLSYESADAKELIERYKIKTVPAIILSGDTDKVDAFKNWAAFGRIEKDVLIFDNNVPVYYDLEKKRFVGSVTILELVDSTCQQCFEPLNSAAIMRLLYSIKVNAIRRVDINSSEGQELIKKHFIDFAPALIFSPELGDYNKELYNSLGSFSTDGSFVVREKMPPYKDLTTGEIRGTLGLIMLEASSCWACKDSKDLLAFLTNNLGLSFSEIRVYDISSADTNRLIEAYSIEYLPAAIIYGDTKSYTLFREMWPKIGLVFKDGTHVLTAYPLLGNGYYYDVNAGKIISAQQ